MTAALDMAEVEWARKVVGPLPRTMPSATRICGRHSSDQSAFAPGDCGPLHHPPRFSVVSVAIFALRKGLRERRKALGRRPEGENGPTRELLTSSMLNDSFNSLKGGASIVSTAGSVERNPPFRSGPGTSQTVPFVEGKYWR
jgi:hypothetical protein